MPNGERDAWRLIVMPPLSGGENMAVDEALLRSFDPDRSLPVLRLYGWYLPALSLGRFQKSFDVLDLERCSGDGVVIVRRITGGGVIYHADELTYSLVCSPRQIPPAVSIKDSFRVLTGFLLAFYRSFRLHAAYATDSAPENQRFGERTPFCFAGRESFDILINGLKIGGNAQRRLNGIIFQHGSIPLYNHAGKGLSYMRNRTPGQAEGVCSLADWGVAADQRSLHNRLTVAFGDYFGIKLVNDTLSEREESESERLLLHKYRTDRWNLEGEG